MKSSSYRAMPEDQLARFQTLQKGNDCTLHAISAALQMLCGAYFKPEDLIEETNRLWWRGRIFRVFPKWAVTPRMQARFVNYLAKRHQLPVKAEFHHLDPEALQKLTDEHDTIALVTIYWLRKQAPPIYYDKRPQNYNETSTAGGHTMLFAAYDTLHKNSPGRATPWGFINSWVQGGNALFWMTDHDFKKSWGIKLPLIGNHATVLIQHTGNKHA